MTRSLTMIQVQYMEREPRRGTTLRGLSLPTSVNRWTLNCSHPNSAAWLASGPRPGQAVSRQHPPQCKIAGCCSPAMHMQFDHPRAHTFPAQRRRLQTLPLWYPVHARVGCVKVEYSCVVTAARSCVVRRAPTCTHKSICACMSA